MKEFRRNGLQTYIWCREKDDFKGLDDLLEELLEEGSEGNEDVELFGAEGLLDLTVCRLQYELRDKNLIKLADFDWLNQLINKRDLHWSGTNIGAVC